MLPYSTKRSQQSLPPQPPAGDFEVALAPSESATMERDVNLNQAHNK